MRGYTEANYDAWLERPYEEAAMESEVHEAYQESLDILLDAEEWADGMEDAPDDGDSLVAAFIESPAYADRFEEWRYGD